MYALQADHLGAYRKMEDQVKHKNVPKHVVELHNLDLPRYIVFIDEKGMIEASFEATMHPPVNKYNPQLKPLRIDTDPIVDSEIPSSRLNASEHHEHGHENNHDQVATEAGATTNGNQPRSGRAIQPLNPYFVTRPNHIAECRHVLKWSYAYGYYMDTDEDEEKVMLFEYLQGEAESFTIVQRRR